MHVAAAFANAKACAEAAGANPKALICSARICKPALDAHLFIINMGSRISGIGTDVVWLIMAQTQKHLFMQPIGMCLHMCKLSCFQSE